MTAPVLKKLLGEGLAGFDESHGAPSRLYELMESIVKLGAPLDGGQVGAISTAVVARRVVDVDSVLGKLSVRVGTTGSAGQTDVQVRVGATLLAPTATVLNTDADGTTLSVDMGEAAVAAGQTVSIEVTAAPTAGADLDATVGIRPASIE